MDKLEQLGQQLATAMKQAEHANVGTIGSVHHKISPLAYELAKNTNPYLTLLKENHDRFKREHGRPAECVFMPLEMLMSLVGDLPQMEQQLFWLSDTKKIEGMVVKLAQDGALYFF
ncbi:hypothetical protein HB762_28060 (plasmid) [Vibrio campbellii]|uniref:Uncharacterized protein n=1 Tax=Vibrio campbellii TaxID=680 RepID=A0ABY5ILH9_9VIBR|nr:hypothetical protein [Vibrio campbellii]UTZ35029.1 hypothetical protein HB762_27585 [Vibrio campbellii]UTZ35119.1 hypothetical protein HB762_28060 [Vibrio campbellii]